MSIKTILDDAAAVAVADLRLDLDQARRRAESRRRALRLRATSAILAAAAVAAAITLVAMLAPALGPGRAVAPAGPSGWPTGLPDRWYYAPHLTPSVTRDPIPAASMVLATELWSGGAGVLGPVLVSADATRYVSLPWKAGDALLALSDDGRLVAWVTRSRDGAPVVVHRIRLADGKLRDTSLRGGVSVSNLLWRGTDLAVITPSGTVLTLEDGRDAVVGSPAEVDVIAPRPGPDPGLGIRGDEIMSPITFSGPLGGSPSIVRTAGDAFELAVGGVDNLEDKRIPITDPTGLVVDAHVLSASDAGVVVRVTSRATRNGFVAYGLSLRFYQEGGPVQIVSRQYGNPVPIAVAAGLVREGHAVRAAEPHFSRFDRTHLEYVVGALWFSYGRTGALVLLAATAGLAAFGLVRRRRRASWAP